jgi:DNA-binding transcriptional LysR family regulator
MNFTLSQLRVFVKVVEKKSVTKASEELHMTQPAVSIQLKNFQEQFDIPLFEVVSRKLFITPFGYEIAESAQTILQQAEIIKHKSLAFRGELTGQLKISVVSTGKYVIPHFLTAFIKQHQGVELLMDVTNKTKVIESLEKNEIDLALVSIPPERLNVESLELMPNRLFLIGNKDFEGIKKIELKELSKHTFIYREKGSGTRQSMETFLRSREIKTERKMELTSNEAVKQAIISGLGLSIMPIIGLRHELKNGELTIIPAPDLPIETKWQLIWLKGKKHSPVVSSYLEYVKSSKKNIIEDKFSWYQEYI